MSRKCVRRTSHCRRLKSGQRAKVACTRDGSAGTRIPHTYAPKSLCHSTVSKLQAAARGRSARKKMSDRKRLSGRKRPGPSSTGGASKRPRLTAPSSKRKRAEILVAPRPKSQRKGKQPGWLVGFQVY